MCVFRCVCVCVCVVVFVRMCVCVTMNSLCNGISNAFDLYFRARFMDFSYKW